MPWPPLPSVGGDSEATSWETHIEAFTKGLQDDDPPQKSLAASTAGSTQMVSHNLGNDFEEPPVVRTLRSLDPSPIATVRGGCSWEHLYATATRSVPIMYGQLYNEIETNIDTTETDQRQASTTDKFSEEIRQIALQRALWQRELVRISRHSYQIQTAKYLEVHKLIHRRHIYELIEQFLNTKASLSSRPAKASDPAVSDTVPKGGLRTRRSKRILPMFLNGSRYDTTPDTGSLENAISADEARRLRLKTTGRGRQFLMGNGSMAISLGVVRLKCAFALGESCVTRHSFHVIENLAVPVIIGKTFLDLSKTLTLHQHRLEAVWVSAKKAFRVMHLNRPRQLMRCYVNGELVHANPDTGSELDLMSPLYARENALKIDALEEGEEWVQFADGSTAKLLGKTHVDLDLYDGRYRSPTGYKGHSRTFYLLDGLSTDVLLGEEVLYEMHVFTEHEDSLVDSDDCGSHIEMNLITWFDKRTRQMSDTLAVLSSPSSEQSKSPLL
jgi:hypothetical protein